MESEVELINPGVVREPSISRAGDGWYHLAADRWTAYLSHFPPEQQEQIKDRIRALGVEV